MKSRMQLLQALAAQALPAGAAGEVDIASLAAATQDRQRLIEQLQACDSAALSATESEALETVRQGQAAWEAACRTLLHTVQGQQQSARGHAPHRQAGTGQLIHRLG